MFHNLKTKNPQNSHFCDLSASLPSFVSPPKGENNWRLCFERLCGIKLLESVHSIASTYLPFPTSGAYRFNPSPLELTRLISTVLDYSSTALSVCVCVCVTRTTDFSFLVDCSNTIADWRINSSSKQTEQTNNHGVGHGSLIGRCICMLPPCESVWAHEIEIR